MSVCHLHKYRLLRFGHIFGDGWLLFGVSDYYMTILCIIRLNVWAHEIWVLLTLMWLDKHWTGNPESVQPLSKLCQRSVQFQKKYRVCPIKYQVCPKSVEFVSKSGSPGQRLDTEIQHLSTHCPTKNYQEAKSDL